MPRIALLLVYALGAALSVSASLKDGMTCDLPKHTSNVTLEHCTASVQTALR